MPVALVSGGTAGLGRELVLTLAARGWSVITNGRRDDLLAQLESPSVTALHGDITDERHRADLCEAVERAGALDLLVHNAAVLGPTPLPHRLDSVSSGAFDDLWQVNVKAPLMLTAELLPLLTASRGTMISLTSDTALAHRPGIGLYGASKAALDHLTFTVAAENPSITVYAVDPGGMRTGMQEAAFPGQDLSDVPLAVTVVPKLLALIEQRPASGRYVAADISEA